MDGTGYGLFAVLRSTDPEFRQLAEKHRELDRRIAEFDRLYYLTSEQERKRNTLQQQKLSLKDRMFQIMRQFELSRGRTGGRVALSTGAANPLPAPSAAD